MLPLGVRPGRENAAVGKNLYYFYTSILVYSLSIELSVILGFIISFYKMIFYMDLSVIAGCECKVQQ